VEEAAIYAFLFAGVMGFGYSWLWLLKKSADKTFGWREWISVIAIGLATLAVVLRFAMPAFWPAALDMRYHAAQEWIRVSFGLCDAALIIGLAGRPRLIVPIALASCGTAVFWVMSTID